MSHITDYKEDILAQYFLEANNFTKKRNAGKDVYKIVARAIINSLVHIWNFWELSVGESANHPSYIAWKASGFYEYKN